jgi:hypothetical protein
MSKCCNKWTNHKKEKGEQSGEKNHGIWYIYTGKEMTCKKSRREGDRKEDRENQQPVSSVQLW